MTATSSKNQKTKRTAHVRIQLLTASLYRAEAKEKPSFIDDLLEGLGNTDYLT